MANVGLDKWIETQGKHLPGAQWVELRHITVNEQQSPVQRWPLVDDMPTLVAQVWSAAQQWTDSVGAGSQRFCVAILDAQDHVLAQFLARVGSDAVGGTAWDSEPANLAGVTKQLMRHNEAHAKISAASTQGVIDRLLDENLRLNQRIEGYEARHIEMLQLYESLITARHDRELEAQRQQRKDARRDALVGKLSLLLPVAAAKLLGPGKLTPDPRVKALAQSLEGEQVQQIAQVLKPEQLVTLAELLEHHAEPIDDTAADTQAQAQPGAEALEHTHA